MAQTNLLSAGGYLFPDPPFFGSVPSANAMTIDATGEEACFIGRAQFQERTGTKDIERVGFRFGTIVKAGGSVLVASLQDWSAATAPLQPDGTPDQTVTIPNDGSMVAGWYRTAALSANRTVAFGDPLSVVLGFDGAGRLGADSFQISTIDQSSTILQSGCTLKTGGAYAAQSMIANLVLEFSDGTFGTLDSALPFSSTTFSQAFNSGSSPDEYAQLFQFPFPVTVEGAWALIGLAGNSSDYECVIYSGTSALQTVTVDATQVMSTAGRLAYVTFPVPQVFAANAPFRISIKPTTANNVTVYYRDMASASHRRAWGGGADFAASTRVDAGAWSDVTTRQMMIGCRISAGEVGGSSGGGPLVGISRLAA